MNYSEIGMLHRINNSLRASPLNRLVGLTPTISGFTTTPSSPENCTDGNESNPTGTAEANNVTGVKEYGYFDFDMGAIYNVLITASVKMWASSAITLYMDIYYKNAVGDSWVVWYPPDAISITASATSEPATSTKIQNFPLISCRHIRFSFKAGARPTGDLAYAKPYEFAAHELKLASTG